MAQTLFYSSNAVSMQLTASIASGDTTCTLSSTSGLPSSFPFKLLFDWGSASQEVVYCTGLSGLTATIQRGKDGTTALAHTLSAVVIHGVSAEEYNNSDLHRSLTSGAHGITGSFVGTTDAQTLTSKTIALGSNTVSGTTAQFNTALTDNDFATLAGTETLTNKTLTSPALSSPTVSGVVSGPGVYSPTAASSVGLTVKGLASQTGDLQEWQDNTGTVLAKVGNTGSVQSAAFIQAGGVGAGHSYIGDSNSPNNYMTAANATHVILTVKGVASQSGNLTEWQNSTGTLLARIAADGSYQGVGAQLTDLGTDPGTNGSFGTLYMHGGALKYRGTSGTITTIAPA